MQNVSKHHAGLQIRQLCFAFAFWLNPLNPFKSLNLDSLLVIFAYTGLDPLLPSEQP